MKRCSKLVVRGKVQSVLYKNFVKEHAQKLKIEGTVQNSSDGNIVINACGLSEKIEDLIDVLYAGPPKSKIDQVSEEPMTRSKEFRGVFRIIGAS